MNDWNCTAFQLERTKHLLGEACVEIAKWKQRAQEAEKKLSVYEKANMKAGVVRLPLGKVKS